MLLCVKGCEKESMMQTLLSVMEKGDPLEYIEKLNIRTDTIIVNQCGREDVRDERPKGGRNINVHIVERKEKGLSRSRNLALFEAAEDICIFCDNDVRYVDDAPDIIEQAFSGIPRRG